MFFHFLDRNIMHGINDTINKINKTYQTNFTKHAEHESELLVVSPMDSHCQSRRAFNHIWYWLLLLFIHEVQICIRKLRTYFTKALDFYFIIYLIFNLSGELNNKCTSPTPRKKTANFNNMICLHLCRSPRIRVPLPHIIVSFFR